jgi:uncharacterized protein YndB with AHSA1/START domain
MKLKQRPNDQIRCCHHTCLRCTAGARLQALDRLEPCYEVWGPRDYPATYLDMDVRRGGAWRCCLRSTETGKELWQGGVFRDVAPPDRLEFTFSWDEEGERGLETLVTVTFIEQDGKTLMTFRHAPFQSIKERDGHQGGWTSTFDRLVDYLRDL